MENLKRRITSLKGNKIGDKFLTIKTISDEWSISIDVVRTSVEEMVSEGILGFMRPTYPGADTYDYEVIQILKRPKFLKRDNTWIYR